MTRIIDPEGREIRALARAVRWRGARVLEVGCGDGRLTLRLARLGTKVVGIDPAASDIRSARQKLPKRFSNRIEYHVGTGTRLKQPSASFDVVLFSWSLWWIEGRGMVHALHEAHRVLKVGGRLIDLEPADRDRKVLARSAGAWHALGKVLVDDPDLRGAGRALAQVVEEGIYRKVSSRAFRVRRYCRTRRGWREYLDGLTVSKPEPGLVQKIDAMFKSRRDMQIALELDLMLRVLKKNGQPMR